MAHLLQLALAKHRSTIKNSLILRAMAAVPSNACPGNRNKLQRSNPMRLIKHLYRRILQAANDILPAENELKIAKDAGKYWISSKSSEEKRDLSHWRNVGRWEDDQNWLGIGENHFNMFEKLCTMSNVNRDSVKTMIEWGQGGGANAMAFAKHVSEFFGVDISQPNLDECSEQLRASGFDSFCPVLIHAEEPESCIDKINTSVNFFLSTSVFQHFPSRSYGVKVLNIAYQLLKDEGIALIQIRYGIPPKTRDYRRNAITFTSYPLDEFWRCCQETGFNPMYISLAPNSDNAYYFLKKA
jgi:hypothetical protein